MSVFKGDGTSGKKLSRSGNPDKSDTITGDLEKAGFNRQRAAVFLTLWGKFGKSSYLRRRGRKSIERDTKSLYVRMEITTDEKNELLKRIEMLRNEMESAGEEDRKLKAALVDAAEDQLSAKRVQFDEFETRFKFLNLLKTLADTRSILGNSLVKKVDRVMKNREFKIEFMEEMKNLALDHTLVTDTIEKLDSSIGTYVKSIEEDNKREVLY